MYFNKKSSLEDKQFLGLDSFQGDTETSSLNVATSNTFYKPPWFDSVREEFESSREGVSLCDYSSFAKVDIWSGGLEVVDFLQYMCSNDVDIPIGHIVHTGMQNEDGGYENDCTVARLADNRYMLMSPSIQQMRSFSWMKNHLPRDNSVYLEDVTSLYTSLCLIGPKVIKLKLQIIKMS
jgi:pyruvate dehydrogenase phosphatase regulatory subunit